MLWSFAFLGFSYGILPLAVVPAAEQTADRVTRELVPELTSAHANTEPLRITKLFIEDSRFRSGAEAKATIIYDRAENCEARYIPTAFQGARFFYLQPVQLADSDLAGKDQAAVVNVTLQTAQNAPLNPGFYDLSIMAKTKCQGFEEKTTWSPRQPIAVR